MLKVEGSFQPQKSIIITITITITIAITITIIIIIWQLTSPQKCKTTDLKIS